MLTRKRVYSQPQPRKAITKRRKYSQRAVIGRAPTASQMWNTRLYRLNTPMPSTFPTRLRYFSNFTVNPGAAGTAGVHVFSANGAYDPDITGAGHQPRGFDNIATMYKTYQVIKSSISVWYSSRNSNTYGCICGVALKDYAGAETDAMEYLEYGKQHNAMLPFGQGAPAVNITLNFDQRYSSGDLSIGQDDTLEGTVSANPAKQFYYHCFVEPIQSVDEASIDCYAIVDYYCVFNEPAPVTAS